MVSSNERAHPPLDAIEATSKEFNRLARTVSDEFQAFHGWLNTLPGLVCVEAWGEHPDGYPDLALGVKIDRLKAEWRLYCAEGDGAPEFEEEIRVHGSWQLVDAASFKMKCAALVLLPKLLTRLHETQSRLVEQLRQAEGVLRALPDFQRHVVGKKGG